MLAFSSILFRVPIKRIETKPMVIYGKREWLRKERERESKDRMGELTIGNNQTFREKKPRAKRQGRERSIGVCYMLACAYAYEVVRSFELNSILIPLPLLLLLSLSCNPPEEYRQHAMVFTLRCFSVFTVATLWSDATSAATLEKAAANPQSVGLGALGSDRPAWVVRSCSCVCVGVRGDVCEGKCAWGGVRVWGFAYVCVCLCGCAWGCV